MSSFQRLVFYENFVCKGLKICARVIMVNFGVPLLFYFDIIIKLNYNFYVIQIKIIKHNLKYLFILELLSNL